MILSSEVLKLKFTLRIGSKIKLSPIWVEPSAKLTTCMCFSDVINLMLGSAPFKMWFLALLQ